MDGQKWQSPTLPKRQARLRLIGGRLSIGTIEQQVDIFGRPIKPYVDVMESIQMLKDHM